jgi:hypothetical protein
VELSFTSSVYETGKLITWIAITIAMLAIVAGTVAEGRGRE